MIAYFDTSAVIPLLVQESGSQRARLLWAEADRVVGVRLVYVEGRAALAMACRGGRISRSSLRTAVAGLGRLYRQMDLVEASQTIVHRAGVLAEAHSLRGYDAVHLAAAEALGVQETVLVAGDGALCEAAVALGLAVART
ncbi:MAG: type II toxin-antitoxin system VapC family toxin [Candidatus Dormiibacterota bacterium]